MNFKNKRLFVWPAAFGIVGGLINSKAAVLQFNEILLGVSIGVAIGLCFAVLLNLRNK